MRLSLDPEAAFVWIRFVTAPEFFVSSSPFFFNLALVILRVAIGVCFIVHGLGKLGIVGPGNLTGFASWLKSLGFPFPEFQARAALVTELAGGMLIALGLGTRIAAFFCLVTMLVAALLGHKGGGYLITNNPPGNEYALNLAIIMLVLILLGPGIYSLDFLIFAGR